MQLSGIFTRMLQMADPTMKPDQQAQMAAGGVEFINYFTLFVFGISLLLMIGGIVRRIYGAAKVVLWIVSVSAFLASLTQFIVRILSSL